MTRLITYGRLLNSFYQLMDQFASPPQCRKNRSSRSPANGGACRNRRDHAMVAISGKFLQRYRERYKRIVNCSTGASHPCAMRIGVLNSRWILFVNRAANSEWPPKQKELSRMLDFVQLERIRPDPCQHIFRGSPLLYHSLCRFRAGLIGRRQCFAINLPPGYLSNHRRRGVQHANYSAWQSDRLMKRLNPSYLIGEHDSKAYRDRGSPSIDLVPPGIFPESTLNRKAKLSGRIHMTFSRHARNWSATNGTCSSM